MTTCAASRKWIVRQIMPSGNESRAIVHAPDIEAARVRAAQIGFDDPWSIVLDDRSALPPVVASARVYPMWWHLHIFTPRADMARFTLEKTP